VLGPFIDAAQLPQGKIITLPVAVHPFASVTVTLKFPASHNPPIDDVVAPVFHK
jgi:hypothetical protein